MAYQMYGVTGNRNLRKNEQSALNARLELLPQILRQQQEKRQYEEQMDFERKQFKENKKQAKKSMAFQEDAQEAGFGLESAKLGVNVATSPYGKGKLLKPKTGGPLQPGDGPYQGGTGMPAQGASGYFSGLNVNTALSGGLAGFGVGKMMTGKSKTKKSLWGMGAGALTGMLSGGYGGALSGGFSGLVGGLFS